MTESLREMLETDAELDLISWRMTGVVDDPVLLSLAALALAVDEEPLPPVRSAPLPRAVVTPAHRGAVALVATVAILLSSSGVAAALVGSPLAPLRYVAHHVLTLMPHTNSRTPGWDLGVEQPGSESGSSGPGALLARAAAVASHPGTLTGAVARSVRPNWRGPVRKPSAEGPGGQSGGGAGSGSGLNGRPPTAPGHGRHLAHDPSIHHGSGSHVQPDLSLLPPGHGRKHQNTVKLPSTDGAVRTRAATGPNPSSELTSPAPPATP